MTLTCLGLVVACAEFSAENRLVEVYFTVPDFKIESAVRISTYPRLVANGRPLASEVRQRNKVPFLAFQTLGKWSVLQGKPTPTPNLA
jgi:hypothetical protein